MASANLPNLFILGAAKAGTTAIWHALKRSPEIYMTFDKEPMFFSADENYQRGLSWYLKTFFTEAQGYKVRGEASPHYLYWADKVAPRIHSSLAKETPKFIVTLRNPVERAYSWYWNMVREQLEDLPFDQAVAVETARLAEHGNELFLRGSMTYGYLHGGKYASQIKNFLKYFPIEGFHFVLQEDLKNDSARVLAGLAEFLGVAGVSLSIDDRVGRNSAARSRFPAFQNFLRRESAWKSAVKSVLPKRQRYNLRKFLVRLNTRPLVYPRMGSTTRAQLCKYFEGEVHELQEIIKRDLSSWLQ